MNESYRSHLHNYNSDSNMDGSNISEHLHVNVSDGTRMHMHMKKGSHHVFFSTKTNTSLMFETWILGTIPGLVSAMLVSFFLAVFFEGIKFYVKTEVSKRVPRIVKNKNVFRVFSQLWKTVIHIVHFAVGYAMMLCVMTYNIWILVVVILGSGIGYYFFSLCTKQPTITAITNRKCAKKDEKVMYRTYVVKDKSEQTLLTQESVC